jgi:hypothetical protein
MNIKEQAISEHLTQGTGYRKLAAKYRRRQYLVVSGKTNRQSQND